MSNKGIKMKDQNGNIFYPCPYYPIGSTFKTTVNQNPSTLFGGTWQLVKKFYDIIHIGSQELYDVYDFGNNTDATGKIGIVGCYGEEMFEGIFAGLNETDHYPGYNRQIQLSAMCTTYGSADINVYLNSTLMIHRGTWSEGRFRRCDVSGLVPVSSLGREKIFNYSGTGVILYVEKTAGSGGIVRSITAHGMFVSNNPVYLWRRTA